MDEAASIIATAKAKVIAGISVLPEFLLLAELWPEHYETEAIMIADLRRHMDAARFATPQQRAALQPIKAADMTAENTYLLVLRGVTTTFALHHGTMPRTPKKTEIYTIKA